MPLSSGSRLGPYEIISPLGAGGMGEVYKARDTRVDRVVAIKASKEQFSERFEREARAVAALNHPHICQLYDVGPNYLVIEYVEGKPVGPAGVEQVIDLGRQMADGLAAAHAAGIVHRDLKPGNILVTRSGQIKILDFGLATTSLTAAQATHARTEMVTGVGDAVGTAAYMSPEQARGQPVDARTDLWSLGVVLYEMAAGERPFDGPTSPVIFEAILGKDPVPVRGRNPDVSPELERIIERLLEKDRETRYQSAADVRADLKRAQRHRTGTHAVATARVESSVAAAKAGPLRPERSHVPLVLLVGLAAVLLAGGVWLAYSKRAPDTVTSPSEYVQITNFTDSATAPAFSPDGRMLTFIRGGEHFDTRGHGQVYVKLLPDGESVQLTSDAGSKYGPVFTPDGSRIAYTRVILSGTSAAFDTWTVPVLGGQPSPWLPNASGLVWLDGRRILFSEIMGTGLHMGIVTATENRGEARSIYFPDHERAMAHYAYASPDGRSLLIAEMDRTGTFQRCRLAPFDGSSAGRQVGPSGECRSAAWSPDGAWMYVSVRGSHIWRQRFPGGTPEQITFGPTEEEGIAVAPDGRSLITSVGTSQSAIWIRDTTGERAISSEGYATAPLLAEDGTRVYYLLRRQSATGPAELRFMDLVSGRVEAALPGLSVIDFDISSDGKEVAFTTPESNDASQIWLGSLDRRSAPRPIARGDSVSFGVDGELVFRVLEQQVNYLYRINKDGSGLMRILDAPIVSKQQTVSPDGEWVVALAPSAIEGASGAYAVAVPVHGGAPRALCAGCAASWAPDGRFFYLSIDTNTSASFPGQTLAIPVPAGKSLPDFPPEGIRSTSGNSMPGATVIRQGVISPGRDPSTYVFVKTGRQSNLFRIPLH